MTLENSQSAVLAVRLRLPRCGTTPGERVVSGGMLGAAGGAAIGAATGNPAAGAAIGARGRCRRRRDDRSVRSGSGHAVLETAWRPAKPMSAAAAIRRPTDHCAHDGVRKRPATAGLAAS